MPKKDPLKSWMGFLQGVRTGIKERATHPMLLPTCYLFSTFSIAQFLFCRLLGTFLRQAADLSCRLSLSLAIPYAAVNWQGRQDRQDKIEIMKKLSSRAYMPLTKYRNYLVLLVYLSVLSNFISSPITFSQVTSAASAVEELRERFISRFLKIQERGHSRQLSVELLILLFHPFCYISFELITEPIQG